MVPSRKRTLSEKNNKLFGSFFLAIFALTQHQETNCLRYVLLRACMTATS